MDIETVIRLGFGSAIPPKLNLTDVAWFRSAAGFDSVGPRCGPRPFGRVFGGRWVRFGGGATGFVLFGLGLGNGFVW